MSIARQMACQCLCNSCTGAPIPEFRGAGIGELPLDQGLGRGKDGGGVVPQEAVGSLGNGNRTLRVGSQCKARNTERRGFLLDSAAVRDEKSRPVHEAEEIQVSQGLREMDYWRACEPGTFHALARARMSGKDHGDPLRELAQ